MVNFFFFLASDFNLPIILSVVSEWKYLYGELTLRSYKFILKLAPKAEDYSMFSQSGTFGKFLL